MTNPFDQFDAPSKGKKKAKPEPEKILASAILEAGRMTEESNAALIKELAKPKPDTEMEKHQEVIVSLQEVVRGLQEVIIAMNAPKKVIRDGSGRMIGVETEEKRNGND